MKNIWIIPIIIGLLAASPLVAQDSREFRTKSFQELEAAFARDGYDVVKTATYQGKKGIMALHRTAVNYESKQRKKVLYVEGNAYEMGYLIGLIAQENVEAMAKSFVDKILFAFINLNVDPKDFPVIWGFIKQILVEGAQKIRPDLPDLYIQEMSGLVDGCKKAKADSKVIFDDLLLLNVGFDAILSTVYALNKGDARGLDASQLQVPLCNAFSVFGNATVHGKHYFGRDFMFPTAGVYEYEGCLIIYNPSDGRVPTVAVSAPGFVGAVAVMNKEHVGAGVDMVPANNCNPARPGMNSLLMVRHVADYGYSAQHALNAIVNAQRGVTWLYFVADGKNDKALVAESGMKTDQLNFLEFPLSELIWLFLLPDQKFLDRYENQKHQQGVMVRWNDYKYPEQFLQFNKSLWSYFEKKYDAASWGEMGYINPSFADHNCPKAYYFPPQRENKDDVLLISNHFIAPSMRLCGMNYWTVLVAEHKYDDIQWRYDELNAQILSSYGKIDEAKAIEIIDFLAPYHKFPEYYKDNKKSSDGKTKVISGSVSLCNLTDRVIHTHIGFYQDEWITITLGNYVD